jgi:sugar phosphate isomerase/epimerase
MSNKTLMFGTWLFNIGPWQKRPKSWEEVLDIAKACGFGGVAPGGFGEHIAPARYDSPDKIDALKKQVGDAGLKLGTMAADIWGPDKKWLTQEGRSGYVGAIQNFVDLAKKLDISSIRIDPNYAPEEITDDNRQQAFDTFVDILKEVGNYGAENNVSIQVEAEPSWGLIDTVKGCVSLIDAVDHDSVRLMYDLCHFNVIIKNANDPYDSHLTAIDALSGRIGSVHVADNKSGEIVVDGDFDHPPTGRHLPLGDGDVPISEVCQRLEKEQLVAQSDERTLDLCFYGEEEDYPRVLEQSIQVMKSIYG